MRLCTFEGADGRPRPGLVAGEGAAARVVDLGAALGLDFRCRCLRGLLDAVPLAELRGRLVRLAADLEAPGAPDLGSVPLEAARLLAPVLRPPKITAVGLNYKDHAAEQGAKLPDAPMLFAKARTSVSGPRDAVRLRPEQTAVDYEVELCAVVGAPGFGIPRERALDHLLGFTVAIDVSDRAAQRADKQFYRAKSFPTFCPTGPLVVTPDAFDHTSATLTTELNGAVMQRGSTRELVFDVPHLVSYVSCVAPLEPGDLILTGTPAGVGFARNPPVFLKAGDRLRCAIEGIGAIDVTISCGGDRAG
jgi:2-keto-4-pentenoate hydratase/2-oxohepta-3-ene-1,7-dioic acid hydratase in catechol pathway